MGRTFALFAVALASLAAAPCRPSQAGGAEARDPKPLPVATAAAPGLADAPRSFERLYLPTDRDTSAYLEVDLIRTPTPPPGAGACR